MRFLSNLDPKQNTAAVDLAVDNRSTGLDKGHFEDGKCYRCRAIYPPVSEQRQTETIGRSAHCIAIITSFWEESAPA